jgi:hypothetical protein
MNFLSATSAVALPGTHPLTGHLIPSAIQGPVPDRIRLRRRRFRSVRRRAGAIATAA